jgi:hypothetical protein
MGYSKSLLGRKSTIEDDQAIYFSSRTSPTAQQATFMFITLFWLLEVWATGILRLTPSISFKTAKMIGCGRSIRKQYVLTISADNCHVARENILHDRSTIPIEYVKQGVPHGNFLMTFSISVFGLEQALL